MKTRLRIFSCLLLLLLALIPALALADVQPEQVVLSIAEETAEFDLSKVKKLTLSASVEPADASQQITWSTSDSSVARVSSRGVVTFRKRGEATITATARKTKVSSSVTIRLTDSSLPDSITLSCGESLEMERYETLQLTPTVLPATARQAVQYKSSSGAVSVSKTGLLTAKKAGTATVTCYSSHDKTVLSTVKVTVKALPTPEKITLTPDVRVVTVGDVIQFDAARTPEESCRFLEWKSSSKTYGSITQEGLFTAKKTGSVTITCQSKQNSRVRATVQLLIVEKDSPLSITLNESELLLHPTQSYQLTAEVLPTDRNTDVAWKSSSAGRVQVTQNGLITAKKTGTATITCYSKANRKVLATVKVKVEYLPAPDSIDLSASPTRVEKGESVLMIARPVPEDHSAEFTFASSDRQVASVSSTGKVTGLKRGEVTITVTSVRDKKVVARLPLTVTDSKCPDEIVAAENAVRLEAGDTWQAQVSVLPESAVQSVSWRSSSNRTATVDKNGLVTAHGEGTAIIYAVSGYDSEVSCPIRVVVYELESPEKFALTADRTLLKMDETARLSLTVTPEDASSLCDYEVSSDAVSVSRDGLVTPLKLGEATITAVSRKDRKVRAQITVTVFDPLVPLQVTLSDELIYLESGNSLALTGSVYPETASQSLTWSSSDTGVVKVDENGKVTAVGAGTATVRAAAENGVYASCTFAVSSIKLSTVIPARTTDVSGISANLQKIDAIRRSSLSQIINLAKAGVISYSESVSRQRVINAAFEMQAFPWMTPDYQRYWTVKYLEKSYVPGKVYYGLPYIQRGLTGGPNRQYNVAKAIKEQRYVSSGKGYYLLNQERLLDGLYVGCDCSSFVSMAYWGVDTSSSYLRTKYMATSSLYKELDSYDELRTGDMLLCPDNHVIMFLYWVDSAKTRMMIIEQGGDGNTVICSIQNLAKYQSLNVKDNYYPCRLASYAQK